MVLKGGQAKHDTSIKAAPPPPTHTHIYIYDAQKLLYESQRYGETYQLYAFLLNSAPLLLHWCWESAQHLPSFWDQFHAQQLVRQDPGKLPPKVIERRFTGCWHVISIFRFFLLQEICCNHNLYHCGFICESTLTYKTISNMYLLLTYEYQRFLHGLIPLSVRLVNL